jgi:large subunit ribosomal protein L24
MGRAGAKRKREKVRSLKIRKDDNVKVIGGKDSGKTGRVVRTEPKRGYVYVEGLNIVKRHQRPTSVKDAQKGGEVGGIIEKEGPIHISNVMLLDPSNNKPTRVKIQRSADGKRKRIAAASGTEID